MNPFPTWQAAEAYLARIPDDQATQSATLAQLGLDAEPAHVLLPVMILPSRPCADQPRAQQHSMTTPNDISIPKKAEDGLRALAETRSEFALSGSEQNPDQGGEAP